MHLVGTFVLIAVLALVATFLVLLCWDIFDFPEDSE